jgi:hypothetical protein
MMTAYQQAKDNQKKPVYQGFVTPAYLAPDYATLAATTRNEFRQRLGRRPSSAELEIYANYLRDEDKNQWKSEVAADRATHAARGRQWDAEQESEGTSSPDVSAGTVQGVDAMSRFDEFFTKHFSGEIAHRERTDQVQNKQGGLFASLNRIAGSI